MADAGDLDPFADVCGHVQAAGSSIAAALLACERLPGWVAEDAGTGGDLASIRRYLMEAGRCVDRAERLSYPLPRQEPYP